MINIGKIQKLTVDRKINSGHYLVDQDGDDVLLPDNLGPLNLRIGQEIEVFVYLDTKGLPIATTELPYAQVGEFAVMKVQDVKEFGAFFDWGIDKDLLVPGNEQKVKVRPYEEYLVRVCLEEGTNRVFGTTKFGKYLENQEETGLSMHDQVSIEPVQRTELGHKVIINKKYLGMIYANETFSPVRMGEKYPAYVKKVRPDGLIDVSLKPLGMSGLRETTTLILELLEESGGKTFLNDKSTPEEIKGMLGVSKKAFKKAVGILYKERKIKLTDDGIELIKNK
ncbi:S1 RNA-binding domain-containing protein [Bacteriovorax sp. DB6_IX]|uniref:CvfB family protein n=1 Tax=Bacteriovorax sp. DB6_IX TaxID=1353530 RepID=UPI000389DB06|nr:S1-like domain-containing RNA-binding protein [Bacteriovorax sp. DB6_IX]EQC43093.1 S1 domain protein [Bacteriovorax sp. DB6_IX]